jgi:integrase
LETDVSGAILGYRPLEEPSEWPLVADGVRMVAAATCDSVPYPVPKLMLVLSGLATFAERTGLARDPLVWLSPETITRYLLTRPALRGSTLQTYRSILLRVREALLWLESGQQPTPKMHAARQRAAPYTPPELARYLMWARGLPEIATHGTSALALLALGAGCGLSRREVLATRGSDVTVLPSEAVVVAVPGSPRLVVCRAMWEEVLAERARTAGNDYLFLPQRQTAEPKNGITNWLKRVQRGSSGLPELKLARLRSTWIVELLRQRVPEDIVAAASGMGSTAGLAPYRVWVPKLTQEATARLLRGWA